MKINNIKNVNCQKYNIQNNSISYPKTTQAFDVFELSFARNGRCKHSKDFLELTKDIKDMRNALTRICMLDENYEFNEEYEKEFVKFAKFLTDDKLDKKAQLNAIALSLRLKRQSEQDTFFNYYLGKIKALYLQGFDHREIESICLWDNFDIFTPEAFIALKNIEKEDGDIADKKIFLSRYCKDENGLTDTNRIPELVNLFRFLDINNLNEADEVYLLMLDKDGKYNPKKYEFFSNSLINLLKYCYKNDANAQAMLQKDGNYAKNLIYAMFDSIIQSSQDENEEFDIIKAYETFDIWFDYVKNNQSELEDTIKIKTYNSSKEDFKLLSINEYTKRNPNNRFLASNSIFKLSALVSDFNEAKH